MNSPVGKAILADIRSGDYAHAGEEESIRLVFDGLPRGPELRVLDVGCGRGGTAAFVAREGWGRVTGVDLDATSIAEARVRYPEVAFEVSDVVTLQRKLSGPFDVMILFNAFYAFPDQAAALVAMRAVARPGTQLAIFDYTDPGGLFARRDPAVARFDTWHPMSPEGPGDLLGGAGFDLTGVVDLTGRYRDWYRAFCGRVAKKRPELVQRFGTEATAFVEGFYEHLLACVEAGRLGGAVVRAVVRAVAR